MNELATQDIIEGCVDDFKAVKRRIADGTAKLYQINQDNLWKGYAESFSEFCEVDLGISKSFASKLLRNWQTFAIDGKIEPKRLGNIDSEKVYLSKDIIVIPCPKCSQEMVQMEIESPTEGYVTCTKYNEKIQINPTEERISLAEANSRKDIQKWVRNEGQECTHEGYDHIIICSNCRARI